MKSFINKIAICLLVVGIAVGCSSLWVTDAGAAAKKSKGGLTQEQLDTMNNNLNNLTRKIYANSLFSPQDNETLINIKLDLDKAMLKSASGEYAPLYYMEANLLKKELIVKQKPSDVLSILIYSKFPPSPRVVYATI